MQICTLKRSAVKPCVSFASGSLAGPSSMLEILEPGFVHIAGAFVVTSRELGVIYTLRLTRRGRLFENGEDNTA